MGSLEEILDFVQFSSEGRLPNLIQNRAALVVLAAVRGVRFP